MEVSMNVSQEHTRSLWMNTDVFPEAGRPTGALDADVLVIGSGIAGLSAAYEFLQWGRRVVVVDSGAIGSGMTARTTAHLSAISDDWYAEFINRRGEEMARLFHESHSAAIARIAHIVDIHRIACNFRWLDGLLFAATEKDNAKIDDEFNAAERLGIEAFRLQGVPFVGMFDVRALRYPGQATFNPALYLRGLASVIVEQGGLFFADTTVSTLEEDGERVIVKTQDGIVITANAAVVATNSPISTLVAIHTKQAPYRTYAMAFEIPKGTVPDALYWDTLDPYHYVRIEPQSTSDILIVGGADHKSGEADDGEVRLTRLEEWARGIVPDAGAVTHRWSGQVMEPVDYAAFIGRNPGSTNIYVATGDSGQGITHGTIAGLLIAELATVGEHRWQELYAPSRKVTRGLGEYVSENLAAAKCAIFSVSHHHSPPTGNLRL
jgi:glycine/D-amino acid oxidase-like deaminating enzyme